MYINKSGTTVFLVNKEEPCPDSYGFVNGGCYKTGSTAVGWIEAALYCANEGGYLVTIESEIESRWAYDYLEAQGAAAYDLWLGLNTISDQSYFEWIDGSNSSYRAWGVNEPSTDESSHQCAYMETGGSVSWTFGACNYAYAVPLCQWNATVANVTKAYNFDPITKCTDPYLYIYGGCYLVTSAEYTWVDAISTCIENGGYLAAIESEAEARWVYQLLSAEGLLSVNDDIWIGLEDVTSEGTYRWTTGSESSFRYWAADQPTADNYEDCVAMVSSDQCRWDNRGCDTFYRALCKWNETVVDTASNYDGLFFNGTCPQSFTSIYGECYFITPTSSNMLDAAAECASRSAYLATMRSETENIAVMEFAQSEGLTSGGIWIGLNDISEEGVYRWLDGSNSTFRAWGSGAPNNYGSYQNCVLMDASNGDWNDYECYSNAQGICKYNANVQQVTEFYNFADAEPCPESFYFIYGACYSVSKTTGNIFESADNCAQVDSALAAIESEAENRWVFEYLRIHGKSSADMWIGLNDVVQEGVYQWLDGTNSTFTAWGSGSPNNYGSYQHCAIIDVSTMGKWNDWVCSDKFYALCKHKQNTTIPSATEVYNINSNFSCPDTYGYVFGGCYKVTSSTYSWFEAATTCAADGAYLSSFHSAAQNLWVFEYARTQGLIGSDVWLGMSDLSEEGKWVWLDDTNNSFTYFSSGQPDNHDGYEHCAAWDVTYRGTWNDAPCSYSTYRALCQWNETIASETKGTYSRA